MFEDRAQLEQWTNAALSPLLSSGDDDVAAVLTDAHHQQASRLGVAKLLGAFWLSESG